jgi:hypothetical protein
MVSAVVTVLSLVVMLLIVMSFIWGAWYARQRYKRTLATQSRLPAHPLDRHVTAILHMQDGNIVRVEKPEPVPVFSLPSSWYQRRRVLVSLGLLVMVLLTLSMQSGLVGETFHSITTDLETTTKGLAMAVLRQSQPDNVQAPARPVVQNASARVVRVDSASSAQYYTAYQLQVWSYSSCSGIAMETVMNAYGRHLIAADVLQVESDLGVWNVQLGLLREDGIALTATHFGFDTSSGHTRSLQDVINSANQGFPVIVSVRDSQYFPGGHIFVIRGGDDQYVYIADSSPANFQHMTRSMFVNMWQGFSAVLTPHM